MGCPKGPYLNQVRQLTGSILEYLARICGINIPDCYREREHSVDVKV